MKKLTLLFSSLLLLLGLTACGGSKEGDAGEAKGKTIEASIEDARYILSDRDGGEPIDGEEADGGILLIDILIKNVSDASVDVFPEMSMQLYDGDSQMDPVTNVNHALGIERESNTSVGVDKQKTMTVMFDVEKDKEYEINILPQSSDYEAEVEDVNIPLDTGEYNESLESLMIPEKALTAYIETIYFDKDNSDYEKYISADKNSLQDDAQKSFKKMMDMTVSKSISNDDAEKHYESFKQSSAEKDEIEVTVTGNSGEKAIVNVEYEALAYDDITEKMRDYKEDYRDNNDFDPDKENEYALKKFDSILDEIDAKNGSREIEVEMKQKDGKWAIDDSGLEATKRLNQVFAEGAVR
ncbi:MAG TPA: DUF5105 domain-containing protein [Pseudogracilibacillus sp.]|nr:DUF5105 domain-containing protein [Pseudogracilibacillus sp.]